MYQVALAEVLTPPGLLVLFGCVYSPGGFSRLSVTGHTPSLGKPSSWAWVLGLKLDLPWQEEVWAGSNCFQSGLREGFLVECISFNLSGISLAMSRI